MINLGEQVVTGVVPPQQGEARIRVAWPSVAGTLAPAATLGRLLMRTYVLAPLAWALLFPIYFMKVLPVLARRYTLTNRRLMIQRGLTARVVQEIPLAEIDDIRIDKDANSAFYRSGTLVILYKGQVRMKLPGVPGPECFREAIRNACMAWVPDRVKSWMEFVPAKKEEK